MLTIYARNVAEALPEGVRLLRDIGRREETRGGTVLVAPCPVVTVYERPTERVLYSAERDANPFFHLAEALWMLAGRNDATFLNQYIRNFGEQFAEPNGEVHGAYGYRWRKQFHFDQLEKVIEVLKQESNSRQAVLQMWDAQIDLGTSWRWKDRPCNTNIYFRIRDGVLDMTVCCRSNDILWGAYGANAVHFSILQEYLATHIGVRIGLYYQFSNNFHAYLSELEKRPGEMRDARNYLKPRPLIDNPKTFDAELKQLLAGNLEPSDNEFLKRTVYPMLMAHLAYRKKLRIDHWLDRIQAPDWSIAAREWMIRRNAYVPA